MFQLEFHGALFQLEQREPEFEPLFRLPLILLLPLLRMANPGTEHGTSLSEMNRSHLVLATGYQLAGWVRHKAQKTFDMSQSSIRDVEPRNLSAFCRLIDQAILVKQRRKQQIANDPVLVADVDQQRIEIIHRAGVTLSNRQGGLG